MSGSLNPFQAAATAAAPSGALAEAESQRAIQDVQAALVIGKRFPRDERQAMDRILVSCQRPMLAEGALYTYSKGGTDVSGPSIRLAEELARGWGNISCGVKEVSRAGGYSECIAYAWDTQTNFRDEKIFHVKHWRDTRSGGYAITDERDIYELIANMGARRKRACILAVIPADVQDSAVKQCELTLKTSADTSPEAVAKMAAAFQQFDVTKDMIEKRLQRRLDSITPAQMVSMKKIYASLRDGMSSPDSWFEGAPQGPRSTEEGDPPAADDTKPISAAKVKLLRQKLTASSVDEAALCEKFGVGSLDLLPTFALNDAMKFADGSDGSNG